MLCASLIEALFWAITYMMLGAVEVFENALYFSIVTYTTLGYGDITLTENYRLLASLQAANGIIIFGWSTAITMAVVQKLYFKK
ncbi:MAG: potassium channel family protein [Bacteroidales bacterium]